MNLKLSGFVLFVNDVSASKKFYTSILNQEIALEIGNINIGFKSGLALWEKTYAQNNIFSCKKNGGINDNLELYFETEDIEEVFRRVTEYGAESIHPPKEQPWMQKVFRFRDPDGFIIEIGETMESVVRRLGRSGMNEITIAEKTMMPSEFITHALKG
jgi:predicted enzyme related to lactoylglutathione lyase